MVHKSDMILGFLYSFPIWDSTVKVSKNILHDIRMLNKKITQYMAAILQSESKQNCFKIGKWCQTRYRLKLTSIVCLPKI